MSKYMSIYNGNPTADGTDGTPVSENTFTNPVNFILDTTNAEVGYQKLAVRCEDGYNVDGDVTISRKYKTETTTYDDELNEATTYAYSDTGGNVEEFSLLADNGYTSDSISSATGWASSITLSDVATTNKIFWLKCATATTDNAAMDKNISLEIAAVIEATKTSDEGSTES